MVRAAVTGAIDYTGADPQDRKWRIKHLILLQEMERREDYSLLMTAHSHWLALLSHGNLTEDSFKDVKKHANDLLQVIQKTVYPWLVDDKGADGVPAKAAPEDTILDSSAQELIKRFKERHSN